MSNLRLISRIHECERNGWNDLLTKVDSYTQSLLDTPSAAPYIKSALIRWGHEVEVRKSKLPPTEEQLAAKYPAMMRQLGAED